MINIESESKIINIETLRKDVNMKTGQKQMDLQVQSRLKILPLNANSGGVLAFSRSHMLFDGGSAWTFLAIWASLAKGDSVKEPAWKQDYLEKLLPGSKLRFGIDFWQASYTLRTQTLEICRVWIETSGIFFKINIPEVCYVNLGFALLNPYWTRINPVFYPYWPRIFVLVWKTPGFHKKHRVYVHTLRILRERVPKVCIYMYCLLQYCAIKIHRHSVQPWVQHK